MICIFIPEDIESTCHLNGMKVYRVKTEFVNTARISGRDHPRSPVLHRGTDPDIFSFHQHGTRVMAPKISRLYFLYTSLARTISVVIDGQPNKVFNNG